ncbi:MAG: response regulator [Culturomica sp.]|jgi:ligand-binding sensor domain-containing protein/signal transduction histidine kinase/DNA-binding response OmpR family regulator|nr:response regulator [Culturomica sp.]
MRNLLVIVFIFLLFPTFGQTGTFYTSDKDLSSSLITSIYQDRRGYIWIATEDGLNKYDGVRFTIYKSAPNDSTIIKNNYVRSLYEDSYGRFWVGCINGLMLYDRSSDTFKEIPLFYDNTPIAAHITSIIESREHEIWIATSGDGVIRLKNDSLNKKIVVDTNLSEQLSSMHLTCIFQDSRGIFWIASENQGLNRYNPKTGKVTVYKAPSKIGSNQITAICEGRKGELFVGTLNNLYRLNRLTDTFEPISHSSNLLPVKSLLFNHKKQLLVGTDGQGIKILNEETMSLENYKMISAPFDFSTMKVHAIFQDKENNIWTGLFQKGVYLDYANTNGFKYWGFKSYDHNVIGSQSVMSLYKDSDRMLWIGTDNDGIYRLDENGNSKHFAPSLSVNSVPHTVLSIIEDDNKNIWMGSYLQGLCRLDKNTGKCTYYRHTDDNDNTARDKIFCITKDHFNKLWIGTNGAGVYVFDPTTGQYINHYSLQGIVKGKVPNDWYVNTILCDRDGLIWIGSYQGLCRINPENQEVNIFTSADGVIPGNIVFSLEEDQDGMLWIGTTEGLALFDRQRLKSRFFTVNDGLPSSVICGILEDEDRNIWLSTHSGISKYLPESDKFINFYASDGLQGSEFSMGAAFRYKDGEMFFGGMSGITTFLPNDINDRRIPPYLFLTGIRVLDKPVTSFTKSGIQDIYTGFVADADTICLKYSDNIFSLEFSTFDFGFAERIHYRYRLEGFSDQWINTEKGVNRINFTNISSGKYTLKVKASIYDDFSAEKSIVLIISPPWYNTWWAKLLYLGFILIIVGGITKFITDRSKHRNELIQHTHIEEINEAKLQFFMNISHEIRTPMSLIISPLEKLISENNDAGKQKVYMLIYRNAVRILQLINQLMDVRKLDKGLMKVSFSEVNIVNFIEDIKQTFEYQAKQRSINFKFIHRDEHLKVWIDMNNFDKVLLNVLSNAFKFTPENGEITIYLTTGYDNFAADPLRDFFEIRISDSGIGIKEDDIEKIFERFYQIASIAPIHGLGTGIGLHLTRSLVELQHGIIFARNRKDRSGSEFIIRLPLGNSHLSAAEMDNSGLNANNVSTKAMFDPYYEIEQGLEIAENRSRSKTRLRILIVEDEVDIRLYLKEELSQLYRILEATNGKEAFDIVLSEKPDLVISDVMMPEMDGIELTKRIKSNININHIPVILLTAKTSDSDKAEGYGVGAEAYVSKPFNIDVLKKRIEGILKNRQILSHKSVISSENDEMTIAPLIKPVILKSSDQVLYEKIINIINNNISNPELNVEYLAQEVGMSRVHMHRKLKEITNLSARDFIKTIRLQQAGELFSKQKLSISEVAYALGFNNLSHFSTTFHKFYGMSPTEFAEKHSKD